MKKWIVRFGALYVFNLVVLLVIVLIAPGVDVGWGLLWAAVVLTLASLWVKPLITKAFANRAAKSSGQRGKNTQTLVRWGTVYVVELIVWVIVVLFSSVTVDNWFWGYLLPPIIFLIGWAIYAAIEDRVEAKADALYDQAHAGITKSSTDAAPAVSASSTPTASDPRRTARRSHRRAAAHVRRPRQELTPGADPRRSQSDPTGQPARRSAASTTFVMSSATVIGPTPPGLGDR